jgi:serine/threonine protein kinase
MSEFRAALEQFLAGELGAEETRRRVAVAATREPQVAPAMLAAIEAYRSAGRLSEEFAGQLQRTVREHTGAGAAAAPPAPAAAVDDATQLSVHERAPAPPPPTPAQGAQASGAQASGARLGPGSVLKGRFVLEGLVSGGDKGGMGVVFKALDRIKQDAQDRNPYVALKLLNEDFKQHPDSMMALQREARRAQSLAHPNIITVYDFDRDGDTFFMAMELLNGSPLDEVIRQHRERGGLPTAEALQIIVQLGRGLSYAHANNIVHSDFKPSNAFLTKDGVVKVLDFGIARATKVPDGEKTRFDAGSLGAMTLPYASCEQFERQDPDPSDDVYALAVVSCELLTGRHPFERPDPDRPGRIIRTDAIAARNAQMKPAPIAGLSGQQWRTLRRGLAFRRADRLRNAAEFLEGMTPRKRPLKTLIAAGAATVLLLVTSGMLLSSYMHRSRLQALTQRLQSHDAATIAAALKALQQYSADERAPVLLNDQVEASLLSYYIGRAHELFNVEAGKYDYAGAMAALKEAQSLSRAYEDSRQLTDALDRLESDRKAGVLRAADAFESELSQGLLIPSQGAQNVRSTLAIIRELDPQHPLLRDTRVPIAFANQVRGNIDGGHLAVASALLAAGLQFAPNDSGLLDLKDRIDRQQSVAQLSAQTGELEAAVRPLADHGATLADFRAKRSQLDALHRAQPDSAALHAAQEQLGRILDPLVASAVQQRQVSQAEATLDEFGDLLPAAVLTRDRAEIGSVTGNAQVREDATAKLRARITQGLANLSSDDASVNRLQQDLQSLEAIVGAGDPSIAGARTQAQQAFLSQSRSMLASRRLTEAQHDLELARRFGLAADAYQAQATAITQAQAQVDADNRARESAAQLTAAKQRVLDQALADHIDVAQAQFAQLRKTLPANDPFVTTDAPRAIAEAYLVRARRAANQTHFDEAYGYAQSAQAAAPDLPEYAATLQRYQSARELAQAFNTVQDFEPLRPALERLREAERATGYRALQVGLMHVVAERIDRVAARDPAEAARLRASAISMFPNLPRGMAVMANAAGSAPAAETLQVTAVEPPAGTGAPAGVPAAAPGQVGGQASTATGASARPGPVVADARTAGNAAAGNAAAGNPKVIASGPQSGTVAAVTAAISCNSAGIGAPAGTACRDDINKSGRGPEMMVIPAGEGFGTYAMMRNEASIADYNLYCASVKGCTSVTGGNDLPVTSISVDDAEKYAAWLSAGSGATYRLPTEREWRRAAASMHDEDANCLQAARPAQGTTLRSTTLGATNQFGLRDVVGNAQEWAKPAGGGLKALGGAIGDPIELCQTAFSRLHNGQPDGRTGFRLLREMR